MMRWLSRYHLKLRERQASKNTQPGEGITWELDDFEYIWDRPLR